MNTILFDMDGVILDSERPAYNLWKQKIPSEKLNEVWERCLGVSSEDEITILQSQLNWSEERCREFQNWIKANYPKHILPHQGIVKVLHTLKPYYQLGVVSSSSTKTISERLFYGLYLFDIIVSGNDVRYSKPAPDIYLKAMKLSNTCPENCWVIEDSYNGVKAAKQAGINNIIYVADTIPYKSEYGDLIIISPPLENLLSIIRSENHV